MNRSKPRNPILLLHGINDTTTVFSQMSTYLTQLGWSVYSLDLVPCNGSMGIDCLAQQVADYIAVTFPAEQALDLFGFSMGGIVGRYYVQRLGGIDRVQRLVTLVSPHRGTWVAYGSRLTAAVQMRPDSPFLRDLNQDAAMLEQINFTSLWVPLDLMMIVPGSTACMPIGRNVKLGDWAFHGPAIRDSRSLKAVAEALAEPLRPQVAQRWQAISTKEHRDGVGV
ncbi:MAG: alpha/beta fold hydrolase [Scytolyngbya sp. HA4215-MV1]|nr:alpha/beta fold hydrolase [Scytolyngbya sp. HA4215-MV1]